MNADHAKEVVKILKKISRDQYDGDDYESRSTIEDRLLTVTARYNISDGIKRFEKRNKKS
tara:strand:- start:519 stop:698 length:180 start_codon:yes stop_codon:yes gene_type:complete